MYGSIVGNIAGISYFLAFQVLGICLALYLFYKEKLGITVLFGSVLGSFAFHWLPTLFAFLFKFRVLTHVLALCAFAGIVYIVSLRTKGRIMLAGRRLKCNVKEIIKENPVLFVLLPLFLYVVIVLIHNTIPNVDGAIHTGQSTYGDMNMHLGFITSIANQKTFPPNYSILPGTQLAYPFLSDSISSSVYIWGTSLRVAYMLPMFFALLQVFFGAYTLAKKILQVYGGSYRGKSVLAFSLFFFNGGIGFIYFLNKGFFDENFTRIFTAFYETPTNYVPANIQWHNIICDMLIPQRATLFGWAMLFPILLLLYKAIQQKETSYFIIAGILAGGLPLIHTHSFLALGILCAGFVICHFITKSKKHIVQKRMPVLVRFVLVAGGLACLTAINTRQMSENPLSDSTLLAIGIAIAAVLVGLFALSIWKCFDKDILKNWGFFLGIVLIIAIPVLFTFTFKQATGDNFVRGFFNWANSTPETMDNYIIFYIKNLGILFVLTVAALIFGSRKQLLTLLPAMFLWLLSEFVLFQPNPYDNNKLMLVAYFFFCVVAADFVWDTIPKAIHRVLPAVKERIPRAALVSLTAVIGVLAAVLTMGREYVADYELYGKDYMELCEWVENNTKPKDIFLTHNNHNNAIASLTGRNIVCGSGSFLYFHGLDYAEQEASLRIMYENPDSRDELLEQYHVSYIVVGPNEYNTYSIPDLQDWVNNYELVYSKNNIYVFAV